MGARSRNKGAAGEREVAELLRPVFPEAQRRASGEESQVDQGRDLKGTHGLCVQVAIGERPPIHRKLAEAVGAARPGEIPVAFTRRDREHWIVSLRAEDFVALLSPELRFDAAAAAYCEAGRVWQLTKNKLNAAVAAQDVARVMALRGELDAIESEIEKTREEIHAARRDLCAGS